MGIRTAGAAAQIRAGQRLDLLRCELLPMKGGVHSLLSTVRRRVSGRFLPIVQTASAGVLAWLIAGLVTDDAQPTFAAIAAVICVGAAFGQRGQKAVNLVGGVVIGITVATGVVHLIGTGPAQLGVMIVVAMLAAVVLSGDNDMVVVEAGVSAILIVTLDPSAGEGIFSLNRILESMIGGATALLVTWLLFPPDPALAAGRGGQAVFAALGRTVEGISSGLADANAAVAETALADARAIDALVDDAHDKLAASREAVMLTPPGRGARPVLDRYERSLTQIDFAVRDTRVLARHALRLVRAGDDVPSGLPEAVAELGEAIWELAAAYDDPPRAEAAGRLALAAAGRAAWAHAAQPERAPAELVGQVRSTAVDLIRAAELVSGMGVVEERPVAVDRPTEELLAV
jgi:uncharacterized membrane protein YccC